MTADSGPCILGFVSEKCDAFPPAGPSSAQALPEWYDTRIGGLPVWPESGVVEVPACSRCGAQRLLVLQAYAPRGHHEERALLLFACNNIRCSPHAEAWLSLRIVRRSTAVTVEPEEAREAAGVGAGGAGGLGAFEALGAGFDWGDDGDDKEDDDVVEGLGITSSNTASGFNGLGADVDWGDNGNDTEEEDDVLGGLETLSLEVNEAQKSVEDDRVQQMHNQKQKQKQKQGKGNQKDRLNQGMTCNDSSTPRCFPSYYVSVEHEPGPNAKGAACTEDERVQQLLQKYRAEEGGQEQSGGVGPQQGWAKEEEEEESENDKAQEGFRRRISRSPHQILRYCTTPLWPCVSPKLDRSSCEDCGAQLDFEMQVLSSCLNYLDVDAHVPRGQKEAGLNFLTVALFTCADDCEGGAREGEEVVFASESFKSMSVPVQVIQDDW